MRLSASTLEATAASSGVGGLLNALQVLCLGWAILTMAIPATLAMPTHYSLLATRYSLLAACCSLLTSYNLLLTLLQLLAISAAISGRVPVVPRVPCNSGWLRPGKMTLAGIADDYVLQLPGTEEGQVHCHLVRARVRHTLTPTPTLALILALILTLALTLALTLTPALILTLTRSTATSPRGVQTVRFRRCCRRGTALHCFQASPPTRRRLLKRTLALTPTASPDFNPEPNPNSNRPPYVPQAPATRVAASVGYAARGTACDAGLRLRAAPLRRAFRCLASYSYRPRPARVCHLRRNSSASVSASISDSLLG